MSSHVSHAWKIYLRENCVDDHVVFFHCIILRLAMCHSRVFSLGISEILNRCIVSPSLKCPRECLTCGKYIYVKSARMLDCCRYIVVFFRCIVSRIAMCHSRVFSIRILEILNRCIVLPFSKFPRGCLTRVKYINVKGAWMWDCCRYRVVFVHCVVSRLSLCYSRVFSLGILEILNSCIVSPSLKCSGRCLTRRKYI